MKPTKPPIAQRFEAEQHAYDRVASLCQPQVVRWAFADAMAWGWHPLCADEGAVLAPMHAHERDADYAYGFDAEGRVRVVRSHLRLWRRYPGSRPNEDFVRYSGDTVEVSEFGPVQLKAVETVALEEGRAVRIERFDHDKLYRWATLEWDGERLTSFRWCVPQLKIDRRYDVQADGTRVPTDPAPTPLPHGVTLESLAQTIRSRLLNIVPRVAKAAGIREQVYSLALAYDGEGNGVLPPVLGFGLERERSKWIQRHGDKAVESLWNPAEFEHYEKPHTQFNDDELEQACRWYNDLMAKRRSDAPARKLLNEVASDLARIDWKPVLATTDDFVVYAVDLEGGDLRKNMRQSVPPDRLARLRAAKLI